MSYNMSYCQFENTAGAISECIAELEEQLDQNEVSVADFIANLSSDDERRGFARFFDLCREALELAVDYDIDPDRLDYP